MLALGAQGPFVTQWQEFLRGAVLGDAPDGIFGQRTAEATRAYQQAQGLTADAIVGLRTFAAAVDSGQWPEPDGWPLIKTSRCYTLARMMQDIDWIVLHTQEAGEGSGVAFEIAGRFALDKSAHDSNWTPRQASCHFSVDRDALYQGCLLKDAAWACNAGNHRSIQIELAGSAMRSTEDWAGPYAQGMLDRAAPLVAELCKRYAIPTAWLEASDIKAGSRGITDHARINDALNGGGGHRDCGPYFPAYTFVAAVQGAMVLC